MANLETQTAPETQAPPTVPVTITKKAVDMVQITKEQEGIGILDIEGMFHERALVMVVLIRSGEIARGATRETSQKQRALMCTPGNYPGTGQQSKYPPSRAGKGVL